MSDLSFGDLVSGAPVCARTTKVKASAMKTTRLSFLIIGYSIYWNGQKIGTNQMTIANTAIVRMDPTLRKSKKRYCPGV